MDDPNSVYETPSASLRILIRWLQHEGQLPGHDRVTLADIASKLDLSRDQLNKYLGRSLNRDEEQRRYREISARLHPILKSQRELPAPILQIMDQIFGPDPGRLKTAVITNPRVTTHKSLASVEADEALVEPLFGLSFVLRIANETIESGMEIERGWSLSLLNCPPLHVHAGLHHPLFKLRQRGLNRAFVEVEGVVAQQKDRLLLEGADDTELRPWNAVLALANEDWRNFRDQSNGRQVFVSGTMLGLSSARSNVAAVFEIFAIPGSVVSASPEPGERERFDQLYLRARDAIGVRRLRDTQEVVQSFGIDIGMDVFEEIARRSQRPILSSF